MRDSTVLHEGPLHFFISNHTKQSKEITLAFYLIIMDICSSSPSIEIYACDFPDNHDLFNTSRVYTIQKIVKYRNMNVQY